MGLSGLERTLAWRNKKIAAGLCASCGKVAVAKGQVRCDGCRTARREHYKRNVEQCRVYSKDYLKKRRLLVLEHYGNKCACCGEAQYEFLAIDHIDGNGNAHRKAISNGRKNGHIYGWLIKNEFPKGFQILCHNCNLAKGFYGVCPHSKIA